MRLLRRAYLIRAVAGYQLGCNDLWATQSVFEQATRIPFMIRVPGNPNNGAHAPQLVEEVDMMPSLVEAATGVKLARCPPNVSASRDTALCTEGFSLMPILKNTSGLGRPFAVSQFPRNGDMGYSLRVNNFRYSAWVKFDAVKAEPDWAQVAGVELYSHEDSPVPKSFNVEHDNIAANPAYKSVVDKLHASLVRCAQRPDLCSH